MPFRSLLSTALVASAALLNPVGGMAAVFPAAPENEFTYSMGVLRIDTTTTTLTAAQLSALFDQGSATYPYPGWNPPFLTSPILFDNDTRIAVGGVSRRLISSYTPSTVYPAGFPQTVGVNDPGHTPPLTQDSISDYTDYGGFLPQSGIFSGQPAINAGPREFLTEIQAFSLKSYSVCSNSCTPQSPCLVGFGYPIGADTTLVRAGRDNIYNNGAPNYLPRSLGMMDSQDLTANPALDFPANSFFDIYPEITLPPVNLTLSINAIPLTGAVLTTAGLPLIIESQNVLANNPNTGLPALPPNVVYYHQTTDFGVDLVFRDTAAINPNTGAPYWSAGDRLGVVTLAGHNPGISDPCAKANVISTFVNAVFGPPTQLAPSAVIGMNFGNANFPPSPTSSYASAVGTNFDGSSLDLVRFTNGVTTLYVRNFKFSNLINPISLPAFGNSVTYTSPNARVRLQTSTDGQNFISGIATGAVQILIVNTNLPTAPSKVFYYAQLLSFNGSGATSAGSFRFRQNPTKISPGLLIVETNGGNYKIGGFLNTSFQWSFNGGGTYTNASRTIQLKHQIATDCGSVQPVLTLVKLSATTGRITWNSPGSFLLQSTRFLSPAVWTDVPVVSPYTFNISSTNTLFFRLTCP